MICGAKKKKKIKHGPKMLNSGTSKSDSAPDTYSVLSLD